MFLSVSRMLRAHISKNRKCYDVKSSTYCFHVNTKILTGFQIYISVPLIEEIQNFGHEGGGGVAAWKKKTTLEQLQQKGLRGKALEPLSNIYVLLT